MSLSVAKRPFPPEHPPFRLPGDYRAYQQSLDSNASLLASQYPDAHPQSIKRLLQQLENNLQTACSFLAKQRLPPPGTAPGQPICEESQKNAHQEELPLHERIVRDIPKDISKARLFLRSLILQQEKLREVGEVYLRCKNVQQENSLLKRAFFKLMVREQEERAKVERLKERLGEAREERAEREGRIRFLLLSAEAEGCGWRSDDRVC